MKLRIKGNSIRLRLTQTEVDQIKERGWVGETTGFGQSTFTCRIQSITDLDIIDVTFQNNHLIVGVPHKIISYWANTEETGISSTVNFNSGGSIAVLIEKDFACLSERSDEDESDMFPNPSGKNSND